MSKHLEVTVTHPLDMVFQDCVSRSCWAWVPDLKERGFGFLGVLAETEGHPNTPSRSTDPRRNGGEPARGLPWEGAWDRTRLRTGYLRDGATWRAGSQHCRQDGCPQPSRLSSRV